MAKDNMYSDCQNNIPIARGAGRGQLMGSDHFRAKGTVIVHLDDKNLPPAGTSSFCVISEHYFDIRYKSLN
jgi:hypothetical protein